MFSPREVRAVELIIHKSTHLSKKPWHDMRVARVAVLLKGAAWRGRAPLSVKEGGGRSTVQRPGPVSTPHQGPGHRIGAQSAPHAHPQPAKLTSREHCCPPRGPHSPGEVLRAVPEDPVGPREVGHRALLSPAGLPGQQMHCPSLLFLSCFLSPPSSLCLPFPPPSLLSAPSSFLSPSRHCLSYEENIT